MPDQPDNTPDPTDEPGTENPPADTENPPAGNEPGTEPDENEGDGEEGEPEGDTFPRTYVERLRGENAATRTKLRELEAALADAKTPEQVAEIVGELKADNDRLAREVLVSKVARKHGLPDDLAARLSGEDEAALEADAKTLLKYVTPELPQDLSGGLNPLNADDDPSDPRELLQRARGKRR